MAADKGGFLPKELMLSNARFCDFYARTIKNKNIFNKIEPFSFSIEDYLYGFKEEQREDQIRDLIENCSLFLLDDTEFDWVRNSERVINFVWIMLKTASDKEMNELAGASWLNNFVTPIGSDSFFDSYLSRRRFSSTEANLEDIIVFFDSWSVHQDLKKRLMRGLKESWAEIFEDGLAIKWLSQKNEEQCKWAWKYVSEKYSVSDVLYPITSVEMYWSVFAVLDHSVIGADSRELFSTKFKKAWDQRVYRKKQGDRLPLNTYISREAKAMLDAMSSVREEKLYQTLEKIIQDAYRKSH